MRQKLSGLKQHVYRATGPWVSRLHTARLGSLIQCLIEVAIKAPAVPGPWSGDVHGAGSAVGELSASRGVVGWGAGRPAQLARGRPQVIPTGPHAAWLASLNV